MLFRVNSVEENHTVDQQMQDNIIIRKEKKKIT